MYTLSFQTAQQLKILPTADTSHDGKDRPSSKHRGSTNVVGGDVPTKSREAAGLDSETGFNHSPFPSVDAFITSTLTKGGTQGSIRRWTYFPEGMEMRLPSQAS